MVKRKKMDEEDMRERHEGRHKDRNTIVLGIATAALVIVTLAAYFLFSGGQSGEITLVIIALVIVVMALFVFREKFRSYKSGLPASDEMSKRTMQKAGYYAWLVSIYALLASRMLGEEAAEAAGDASLVGSYMMIGGIVIPALAFFAMYFWFGRRGDAL